MYDLKSDMHGAYEDFEYEYGEHKVTKTVKACTYCGKYKRVIQKTNRYPKTMLIRLGYGLFLFVADMYAYIYSIFLLQYVFIHDIISTYY